MKKVACFFIILFLGIQMCGCSETDNVSTTNVPVIVGDVDVDAPTEKNSICEYKVIQNAISPEREVTLCYADRNNYYDITALHFGKQGLSVSEDTYSFTSYQNFPTSFSDEILEFYSIKNMDEELGQPFIYGENNDIAAMLYKSYNISKNYSLIYKKGAIFNRVDMIYDQMPFSIQITDKFIYIYSMENNSEISSDIIITKIELKDTVTEGDKFVLIQVPISSIGLEEIDNTINHDNIFIINNILYFSFNHFGKSVTLAVCDLTNMRGTFISLDDVFVDGRLFVQENKIGLMIMDKQENSLIYWYDFDPENIILTEACHLAVSLPEFDGSVEYELYLFGYNFYYIDGLLCGFLYSKDDFVENMAYVEIVAATGKTSTFIPIKNSLITSHKTWNYIIRKNGKGLCKYGGEL